MALNAAVRAFRLLHRVRASKADFKKGSSDILGYLMGVFWVRYAANLYTAADLSSKIRVTDCTPFLLQSLSFLLVYAGTVLPLFMHRVYGDLADHPRFVQSLFDRRTRFRASLACMVLKLHPAAVLAFALLTCLFAAFVSGSFTASLTALALFVVLTAAAGFVVFIAAHLTGIRKEETGYLLFLPAIIPVALNPEVSHSGGRLYLSFLLFDAGGVPPYLLPLVATVPSVMVCLSFLLVFLYHRGGAFLRTAGPFHYSLALYGAKVRPVYWVPLYAAVFSMLVSASAGFTRKAFAVAAAAGIGVFWLAGFLSSTGRILESRFRVRLTPSIRRSVFIRPVLVHAVLTLVPAAGLFLFR